MKRTLLAIAAATALGATALAVADTTTVHDPLGDSVSPSLDIKRAVAGHAANGRLEHVVVVDAADRFTKRQTFIFLRARGDNYVVGKDGVRRGTTIVGPAHVDRVGDRIVMRFGVSSIGNPGHYRWQAFISAPDEKPFDAAPDSGTVLHVL